MTLYVAVHKTEYGNEAYLYDLPADGKQPPDGEKLAVLLREQGHKVTFRPDFGDELISVYVNNYKHLSK